MRRFFCPAAKISQDKITLDSFNEVHHIKDVLRLKEGEWIFVFDNQGNEYGGPIREVSSRTIVVEIQEKRQSVSNAVNITVACAIPKKQKMDDIVDKLTQLGVDRIIPLEAEHVVVKLDKQKKAARQKRWEKIALAASQQSKRGRLPVIEPIMNIQEVLSGAKAYDLKLIPVLLGKRKALKEVFINAKAKNILILIGPEGDFTAREVDLAVKYGCVPVTLGELVLRVETAAVAVASFIKLYAQA